MSMVACQEQMISNVGDPMWGGAGWCEISLHCLELSTAIPQPFWLRGLVLWKAVFPWMVGRGVGGSGGNASDGEPLTSHWVAQLLTDRGLVLAPGLGAGDPWFRG